MPQRCACSATNLSSPYLGATHEAIHHTRPDGTHFPADACPLLHTLSSGRPVRLDNELLWRKDGTSFIAEYSSFPLSEADGAIKGSVITFIDRSVRLERAKIAPRTADRGCWGSAERRGLKRT